MENVEKRFTQSYDIISHSESFIGMFRRNIFKICKFCNKTSDETTFNNKPHVLPELLSKNSCLSNDECDTCNSQFGNFESDLANFSAPYLTILGQKGKHKIATFQSRSEGRSKSTIIKNIDGEPSFDFRNNLTDFEYNKDDKALTVTTRKKKFLPINVFKSLVKIALSICPNDELNNYRKTIQWLFDNEETKVDFHLDVPMYLFRTRFVNKSFQHPSAVLYRRKDNFSSGVYAPRLSLIVCSGVLIYQISIPFCSETQNLDLMSFHLKLPINELFILDQDFDLSGPVVEFDLSQMNLTQYDMNYDDYILHDEKIVFGSSKKD